MPSSSLWHYLRKAYLRWRIVALRERRYELREWERATRIQAACDLGAGYTKDAARWHRAGDAAMTTVHELTREIDRLEDQLA